VHERAHVDDALAGQPGFEREIELAERNLGEEAEGAEIDAEQRDFWAKARAAESSVPSPPRVMTMSGLCSGISGRSTASFGRWR